MIWAYCYIIDMTNTKDSTGIGKVCKNCGLPPSETVSFRMRQHVAKNGSTYKQEANCRTCESLIAKQYRKDHPDRLAKTKEVYRDTNFGIRYHVQEKISTWKKASSTLSDLTVEYLINLYYQQNGLCYFTGEPMVIGWVDGKVHHNTLSLDKLDPNLGYVQGNVVWCTYLVNTMKQSLNEKQFIDILQKIIHQGEDMPVLTTSEQLKQLAAHARLGALPAHVESICVKAAQEGLNAATVDIHDSKTAYHPFLEMIGPHYRKQYNNIEYRIDHFNEIMENIVSDLKLVTGYNIERDTNSRSTSGLVLFLKITWL